MKKCIDVSLVFTSERRAVIRDLRVCNNIRSTIIRCALGASRRSRTRTNGLFAALFDIRIPTVKDQSLNCEMDKYIETYYRAARWFETFTLHNNNPKCNNPMRLGRLPSQPNARERKRERERMRTAYIALPDIRVYSGSGHLIDPQTVFSVPIRSFISVSLRNVSETVSHTHTQLRNVTYVWKNAYATCTRVEDVRVANMCYPWDPNAGNSGNPNLKRRVYPPAERSDIRTIVPSDANTFIEASVYRCAGIVPSARRRFARYVIRDVGALLRNNNRTCNSPTRLGRLSRLAAERASGYGTNRRACTRNIDLTAITSTATFSTASPHSA